MPAPLRSLGGLLVMTRLEPANVGRLRGLVGSCDPIDELPAGRPVLQRVGVGGRSLTFVNSPGRLHGCDIAPRSSGTPFCGITGRRRRATAEPGLTICQDRLGRPVAAFAWIDPVASAAWVVVDQPRFREVYAVGGGLPVRVATVSVPARGAVPFRTAQYDRSGRLLVSRTVFAVVAG